ncbi:MAG: hypothetical protein AAF654_03925 [Myxococcota bacterium]
MPLVAELKRRNVFRVASIYLVVAWLLLQLAGVLESALNLPEWFDGVVTALVLLGFPVALVLAWAFELTPDGVRRTTASDSTARARALDWVVAGLLVVVAALMVWERTLPRGATVGPAPAATVAAGEVAVAVLPFADLSPEGDQDYFSDGLAEELLNVLRRDAGIRVAGRTSSFAFKGKGVGAQQIAESLNVSHVLEGSVRKAGDRIRVSVQLVNGADGFPVFSESYDRKLKDIFAVQDDIARSVGRALQLRFSLSDRAPPEDVRAYEDYLTARELLYTRIVPNMYKADALLAGAIARAPEYAPAYSTKAVSTMLLSNIKGGYGDRDAKEALAEAKTYIDRALELDPNLADAHAALGLYRDSGPGLGDPVPPLTHALELDPNHTEAQLWLANSMPLGKESFARLERLVEKDPAFIPAISNLAHYYSQRQEFDRARALLDRAAKVPGMELRAAAKRPSIELAAGELARAYTIAKEVYEAQPDDNGARSVFAYVLMLLGEYEESVKVGVLENQVAATWASDQLPRALALIRAQPPTLNLAGLAPSILLEAGRYEEAVTYFETIFGSNLTLKDVEGLGSGLTSVAYAYRKLGRSGEANRLIGLGKELVRRDRNLGYAGKPNRRVFYAELEAAQGNLDGARAEIQGAIDSGLTGAITKSPVLDLVLPDGEMLDGIGAIFRRTNEERAKLGWPPISPPTPKG